MAGYTTSEILNEVSRIFRARISPGRDGGTLNTRVEYEQLIELSYITFLLHTDAIFYLALLARNSLNAKLIQEINLVEDMLVALDDLGQVGKAVKDSSTLSNANTALLALDAAQSVANRPETRRFTALMDKFAEQFRSNIISRTTRSLVRPREDARNILQTDLQRLAKVHDQVLTSIFSLRDLLDNFNSLEVPSRVASTTITNIRANIQAMVDEMNSKSDAEILSRSRQNLLTTLAAKKAVQLLSGFADPTRIKVRSPVNPIPDTANHFGRVVGDGTPAFVLSGPGPWELPMTDSLEINVNGEALYTIDVDTILGAALNGRSDETFNIDSDHRDIYAIVDKEVHEITTSSHGLSSLSSLDYVQLGFKHLGVPVVMIGADQSEQQARSLSELRTLQTFTVASYNSTDRRLTGSGFASVDEGVTGFTAKHVGSYVLQGNNRWEIVEYEDATHVILSVPEVNVGSPPEPAAGAASLRGQTTDASGTSFSFLPALTIAPTVGKSVFIGPAVKTARFGIDGAKTIAGMITDIRNHLGGYDTFYTNDLGPALNRHVQASPVANNPGRLSLAARSKMDSYLQIGISFPRPKTGPATLVIVERSAHERLGFLAGESDSTNLLTPAELARWVNEGTAGVLAEVLTTEKGSGDQLSSWVGTTQVSDSSVPDFSVLVSEGDQIEIRNGTYSRSTRQILSVGSSFLTLSGDDFRANETGLTYRLFREQVKISTTKTDRGSSIEIVSSPTELGFPSSVHYGSISGFEAVNKRGELFSFGDAALGIKAGDILRVVGLGEFEIVDVGENLLSLAVGLPSNVEGKSFEVKSSAAEAYMLLSSALSTYTTSASLLKKNKLDESIDSIDAALTAAVLPGQNFASSRNKARRILADFLSILTASPRRSDEYVTEIPVSSMNLEDILSGFTVDIVPAMNSLIGAFVERKYNRAVDLLRTGQIVDFFNTNEETGSYGGALIDACRTVDGDLPASPTNAFAVDQTMNTAVASREGPDAEKDFGDTEGGGLNIEE
jgi:hypothetical protein